MTRSQRSPTLVSTLLLCVLGSTAPGPALPPTEPPLMDNYPFMVIWNAPTERCTKLGIPLDTSAFQAVTTTAAEPGQFLTIFYENRLGLFPKVDTGRRWCGGLPQKGNLKRHLEKAQADISNSISRGPSPGLAVIDWESWRPLWEENWGSKRIYQKLSVANLREKVPFLSSKQITRVAREQFQNAARRYMEKTVDLGVKKRPNYHWGFYLYPDCHNYNWEAPGYTGECSEKTRRRNDKLLWLWQSSTALYPSIYLHISMRNSPSAAVYVQNRVQEALRVAALPKRPYTVPIYVYSRPLYRDQNQEFLTQEDLVSSLGESVALGASGAVFWGASADYTEQGSCEALSGHLVAVLSPYLVNVTAAARVCSDLLCQGNGRCVRKSYNSSDYLHLNPNSFTILRADEKYMAVGLPSLADLATLAEKFTCQCYAGRKCSPDIKRPGRILRIRV